MGNLEYGLPQDGFISMSYIKVTDRIAHKLDFLFQQIAKLTVVVQDNSSIHKSREVCASWKHWAEQRLLFLLPHCFDLNSIETQWHQVPNYEIDLTSPNKKFPQHERVSITEQIFNNKYDLMMKVIRKMENRREIGTID